MKKLLAIAAISMFTFGYAANTSVNCDKDKKECKDKKNCKDKDKKSCDSKEKKSCCSSKEKKEKAA
ncbi:MAG: hypothetical protein JST62_00575 [Bacteroidetes bacterium]|jgi:hypothetical protein|nr:hypothetical protein [Bacteroidota bacterium]